MTPGYPTPASNAASLLGRILLSAFFVPSGLQKIIEYAGTAGYMAQHGVPGQLLPLVVATELICGLMILFGWRTRLAAFLLAGFTLLTLAFFHWPIADATEQVIFFAELGVAGAFLLLLAHGAGGWSLDARRERRRARALLA